MIWLMRRLDWKHETLRHSMGVGRGQAGWLDGSRAATAHLSVVMVCRELVGWLIRYHAGAGEYCSHARDQDALPYAALVCHAMLCPTTVARVLTLLSCESVRAWVLCCRTRQALACWKLQFA